jgi:dienelactone hydrolase
LQLRADLYLAEGFAVLFPDSFGSRGVREVCTIRVGERTDQLDAPPLDALAALDYLAHRPDIAPDRVALLGWSHGGSDRAACHQREGSRVASFRAAPGAPFFPRRSRALSGLQHALRAIDRWQLGTPTRIHIGELDDWTPARPCVQLGEAMQPAARTSTS